MPVKKQLIVICVTLVLAATTAIAQNASPDASTAIRNAVKAMGDVKSIRYSGSGRWGVVGMSWNPTSPWHTTVLNSYTRTIDYATGSSREDTTRNQENPPVLGGEAPYVDEIVEGHEVVGKYAWNQPVNAHPTLPPDVTQPAPAAVEERNLQIILTPHGFLKAALENHATAKSATEGNEKVTLLTYMAGKYKIVGTLNSKSILTKIDTWMDNPVLGDMLVETKFLDYKDFNGVKFPTHIVQEQGGSMTLDLNVKDVQPNVANATLRVPENVLKATVRPETAKSEKMADGVWFIHGGHNSVLVEFKDFLAVVDAPVDEARSVAVLAEVKRLVPDKPVKYVINTHHHFDHSGGLRTYVAEGATVITHENNKPYYETVWKYPHTIAPDRLSEHPREPTFITFKNKYVLTDGTRNLEVHLDFGDMHDQFLSFAWLPKEKILIEADDFSGWYITPLSLAMWNNLYGNLQRLGIEPETIAPLHGDPTTMAIWLKTLRDSIDQITDFKEF
jgi:hypothetical protein